MTKEPLDMVHSPRMHMALSVLLNVLISTNLREPEIVLGAQYKALGQWDTGSAPPCVMFLEPLLERASL